MSYCGKTFSGYVVQIEWVSAWWCLGDDAGGCVWEREREREREAMSEKIKKNGKRMNILLNKCVEKID